MTDGQSEECTQCSGTGRIHVLAGNPVRPHYGVADCRFCDGTGEIDKEMFMTEEKQKTFSAFLKWKDAHNEVNGVTAYGIKDGVYVFETDNGKVIVPLNGEIYTIEVWEEPDA